MKEIKKAVFLKSSHQPSQCPPSKKPEYAFIGRSNVGKSSLINMITNHGSLAKTSGTPGKTQLINHFEIDDSWFLVDLPGYGYARVSKVQRANFHKKIENYLTERTNLLCTFVLVDSRHAPQKVDLEFMEWMGQNGLPFAIVYTKTDKLTPTQREDNRIIYNKTLLETWESLPPQFDTSATKKEGKEGILELIENTNKYFKVEQ